MMMMGSKYIIDVKLGEGSFGCVYKAFHKYNGEVVAIKVLKYKGDNAENLREAKILCVMKGHPNIVQLKDVMGENGVLSGLVFEYMDSSLLKVIQDVKHSRRVFSESVARDCCFQILKGLDYIHKRGYFHRDLKPENLLVREGIIKIADLGSATEFKPDMPNTEYITTLWYRAPEVLLQSSYGPAIDLWAMGAIMAELFLQEALFPGTRGSDQLYKICRMIGSPSPDDLLWLGADAELYNFPQFQEIQFYKLMRHVSDDAFDLMARLLSWNPSNRPTTAEALRHPFFQTCYEVQTLPQCSTFAPPNGIWIHQSRNSCSSVGPLKIHIKDVFF